MRMTLAIFACLVVGAYAGMVEKNDTNFKQELIFTTCSPDTFQSVIVGISIDLDSGFVENGYALTDTCKLYEIGVNGPLRDSKNRIIPGTYNQEYWLYVVSVLVNGDVIAAEDTLHVTSTYRVPGCGGLFIP